MTRILYTILFGLVLGGVIHIVTILGLPRVAENDAWARLTTFGPDFRFNPIPRPAPGTKTLPLLDPAFTEYVCRFNLEAGPVRIRGTLPDLYWSVAIFDGRGVNAYNLNDRALGQKPIDILVADQEQIVEIREDPPADFNDIIIVDWKSERGFVVIRVFSPTASDARDAELSLGKATCATYTLG
jgi:uncharacterized membrane protein